ncbi:TPA: hypothetical protein ACNOH1_000044 [Providencia rettgeri]
MKTVQILIAENLKPGDVISTKTIQDDYCVTSTKVKSVINILVLVGAVKKMDEKAGKCVQYVIAEDALEKVMVYEERAKPHRRVTPEQPAWSLKNITKEHNPLILRFDALLAGVRS